MQPFVVETQDDLISGLQPELSSNLRRNDQPAGLPQVCHLLQHLASLADSATSSR